MSAAPLILDLDGSVGPLAGEIRIPLQQWQEGIRFGCGQARFTRFCAELEALLPDSHSTTLMGSGDFHHLSWPLIERCIAHHGFSAQRPLRVVVLDNHPDNMRFPWGVHCGSWVRRVALHPAVSQVHVAGITSMDIGRSHAWENYLTPLRAGKLTYWSCGVDTAWSRFVGASRSFRNFDHPSALVQALVHLLSEHEAPTYLSIDKDVFSPDVVRTNWDQGAMQKHEAFAIITALQNQLAGSDITGDVSAWRYSTWWKRLLSAGDGQDTEINTSQLQTWQGGQHALNVQLVEQLSRGKPA